MIRSLRIGLALGATLAISGSAWSQTTHTITQTGLNFSPAALVVDCGDTVEWIFTGFGDHTVTEATFAGPAFNELLTPGNPLVSVTFNTKFLFENPRAGNVYDYVCLNHVAFNMDGDLSVVCPWVDEGSALAGVTGDPLFYGDGPLTNGSLNTLQLENAAPNANGVLFVALGPAGAGAPFKGGTLIPVPILLQVGLTTSPTGTITLPFLMPGGLTGVPLLFQWAVSDAAAIKNVSLSNAMSATGQ